MSDDKPINRKGFFGEFFSVLREGVSNHVDAKIAKKLKGPVRPPGAIDEVSFLSTCTRCNKCFEACPHGAIFRKPLDSGLSANTPYLEPATQACHLCEDFPCIAACDDKALLPVKGPSSVRMGRAVVNEEACHTYDDKVCTLCYDVCPFPDEALTIDDDYHPVVLDACTGCGACHSRCPLHPVGIQVMSLVNYRAHRIEEDHYFGIIKKGEDDKER